MPKVPPSAARKYRNSNVEKVKEWKQNWNTINSEKKRAWRRDNKQHIKEYNRQYYDDHSQEIKQYTKEYFKDKPEKAREYSRRRRAHKLNSSDLFRKWMLRYYRYSQGNTCFYCGTKMYLDVSRTHPQKENLEHLIPLSRGGLHCWENTVLACRKCNGKNMLKPKRSLDHENVIGSRSIGFVSISRCFRWRTCR